MTDPTTRAAEARRLSEEIRTAWGRMDGLRLYNAVSALEEFASLTPPAEEAQQPVALLTIAPAGDGKNSAHWVMQRAGYELEIGEYMLCTAPLAAPTMQQISDYLFKLDKIRREVIEQEARALAAPSAAVDEAPDLPDDQFDALQAEFGLFAADFDRIKEFANAVYHTAFDELRRLAARASATPVAEPAVSESEWQVAFKTVAGELNIAHAEIVRMDALLNKKSKAAPDLLAKQAEALKLARRTLSMMKPWDAYDAELLAKAVTAIDALGQAQEKAE